MRGEKMTKTEKEILKEIKRNKWNVDGISFDCAEKVLQFEIQKEEESLNERITLAGWRDMDFLEEIKAYQKRRNQ